MSSKPLIQCPDCLKKLKVVEKVGKTSGHQLTLSHVGTYYLYECSCGYRWWDFKRS